MTIRSFDFISNSFDQGYTGFIALRLCRSAMKYKKEVVNAKLAGT
jgi:hypothetical protein